MVGRGPGGAGVCPAPLALERLGGCGVEGEKRVPKLPPMTWRARVSILLDGQLRPSQVHGSTRAAGSRAQALAPGRGAPHPHAGPPTLCTLGLPCLVLWAAGRVSALELPSRSLSHHGYHENGLEGRPLTDTHSPTRPWVPQPSKDRVPVLALPHPARSDLLSPGDPGPALSTPGPFHVRCASWNCWSPSHPPASCQGPVHHG